jgi:hypothetical protein
MSLPLDSPDWTPFDVLHPLICAQTGNRRFADRDLTDAMASGRVRSMRRRVSPRADEPERELLLPSFWADYEINSSWSDILAQDGEQWLLVVERNPRPPPWRLEPVPPEWDRAMGPLPLRGYVFYAWEPDCKFGLRFALEDTKESVQEKPEKSGRPGTIKWQDLRVEIVQRCWRAGKFVAPEKQIDLVLDLQKWHRREFKSEPNHEDLRKFVGDAIAILKLVGR